MFPSKALLSLVFIALSVVDASPLSRRSGKASLGFTTKINARDSALNLAEKDRARVQALIQSAQLGKRDASFSVVNNGVTYTAQVGVGSPPTDYTLLIDTGSANTWVGASSPYVQTSTSYNTGNTVSVSYGSGSFSGNEYIDQVTLSSELVIPQQSIGVASQSTGISNVDGILGVGPGGLTVGTVSNTQIVPTVTDNLFADGTISEEVLGIYYVPASETDSTGQLTFGGYDSSLAIGIPGYVPLTSTSPASQFWGIDQSIDYGGQTILSTTAGIVDTGTTLILIASDAFSRYQSLTGGVLDSATGLLTITLQQYDSLQPLAFITAAGFYELSANGQIWPRSLNTAIGGSSSSIYLVVSDIGTPSGSGLDFINGYSFLERYYSIYDTTNQRVGFALTDHTFSLAN